MAGWVSGPRGPAPGTGRFLSAQQEAQVRELICRHLPDALGLPHALGCRAAVRALVEQRCGGVRLAVRSMGTYLARWGFTAQKPLRRADEQSAEAVQRWLQQDDPAIRARAKREKGTIFWGDETGLRSDDVRGRSDAPQGHTPVVRPSHKRVGLGLISAVTNKGELRWMILEGAIKAATLIRFCERLIRDTGCKVFLILDNLPVHRAVHRARSVQDWLAERRAEIEVFDLPADSPELNPDEELNADLKRRPEAGRHPQAASPQQG